MPNLIPPADWREAIPPNEDRPDMIDTPRNVIPWDYYLTGKEGYCGRDEIESGGMYFHDGRPLIQTADWVSTEADLIHHKELKAVYKYFCDKKFPDKIELGQRSLTVFEKDEKSELYVQAEDDMGGCWTCFKTYKTIVIGYSSNPDADRKAMRKGMQRVIDFFLINQY